ncbi:tyrosine-type recombinase/integrase [Candidatus Avelusimicrobium caledoniensis]|uniref:tyrosine-type recombinase/integrase n=1 Tax=Candidatus Avelusimicrobium caledoniensis TaxID=3416220 RepID=UPI003D0B0005
MKIYQDKKGRYGIDYKDKTGKRHRQIVATNESAAKEELAKRTNDFYQAKNDPRLMQESQLFKDMAKLFTTHHVNLLPSQPTYLSMFKRITTHFGNYTLKEVTPLEVQTFYNQIVQESSASTADRYFGIISKFFNCLSDWDKYSGPNPCRKVKKQRAEQPFEPHPINEQEIQRLLPFISDEVRPCVTIGFYTGLRRQELLGLRWENIDFTHRTIYIPKTKTERPRTIGLTADIEQILQGLNPQKSGLVFEKVTKDKLKYQLNKASAKSGVGHIRPHDMRHSFAINFLNRGGSLEFLQRLLGHSKITTTQRYLRFKTGEIASKMMVMDGMIPLSIV